MQCDTLNPQGMAQTKGGKEGDPPRPTVCLPKKSRTGMPAMLKWT